MSDHQKTATFHSLNPLHQRIGEELEHYGLWVPDTQDEAAWELAFGVLLKHIYSNHKLALAAANKTIEILSEGDDNGSSREM